MCALAVAGAVGCGSYPAHADVIKKVFVIALENHNWTQPNPSSSPQQLFQNPAAPFINSLANGTSGISNQVAYARGYINAAVGDHPSEPNYLWAEAGTNFGVNNDDDPYKTCTPTAIPDTVQNTNQHLSAFLTVAGKLWRSYQEDTDVNLTNNTVLPVSSFTVPLFSQSGVFSSGVNAYNYSNQYNYATKHDPMALFADTDGGCNTTPSNPLASHYAPLQQLAIDLANNTVADYNWITPDQFNEQHSPLTNGYGQFPSSDQAAVAEGDNFLARVVPLIMSSQAYQDHGMIVLWWDETEGGDSSAFNLPFFIISQDVHPNVNGLPYSNTIQYSHSSFLRTMQEIFNVDPKHGFNFLGGAATANDLSDLLGPGVTD
jgi:hypothetical protein